MDQWDRAGFTSLSRRYWLECFWSCCQWSGWAHRVCNILYQFMWSFVHLCRTRLTYNNDKPWFNAKHRQLCQAKEDAYRKGDKVLNKQAKYTLEKEIRISKRNYSDKLRIQISFSDSASVWKGMKDITTYKTPSPSTVENQQQADNLNEFYCRFEKHLLWHPPCEGCQWLSSGQLSDQQSSPWLCSLVNKTERPFEGSGNICRCFELFSWLACHHILICWDSELVNFC